MTASCPGFLDQYGIWNNGFDCSSPQICCGTETNRYCCTLSTSTEEILSPISNNLLSDKWFILQLCAFGLFLGITILICLMIYQCLITIRRYRRRRRQMSIFQVPLPDPSSSNDIIQHSRFNSNRISTISCAPSDVKSRCTETSIIFNTPLNIYPVGGNNRHSTSTSSSSYYMFPNEFEQLCR